MSNTSSPPHAVDKAKLAAMVAKLRASRAPAAQPSSTVIEESTPIPTTLPDKELIAKAAVQTLTIPSIQSSQQEDSTHIYDKYGKLISLNAKQQSFVELATSGSSCVLIGAAGTGKTTCQRAVTQSLISSGKSGLLESGGHKHLVSGTPGIIICAYTRRAAANIRRNMSTELQGNCLTIHKLLEYSPVYYDVQDPESGETKTTMRFEPLRHEGNPLPSSIRTIIFEESSMIGTSLHQEVLNACPHPVQFIYLGDIQQLPPVFGPAILGFKLLELPVIELTEVYRQALESPIISLAHRILSANPIPVREYAAWKREGQLTIHPWKKKIDPLMAVQTLGVFFTQAIDSGLYDAEEDIILIPFNKSCGTDELNKIIANHLARKRGALTHQVIAGFRKIYLSEGDKVLYDKEDAIVIGIERNPSYGGAEPIPPSKTLDYDGHDPELGTKAGTETDVDPLDFLLSQVAASDSGEDRVKKASHRITLQMRDSEQEITIESAGELNSLLLAYSLTVHKSQGSEWRKVFLALHQSHATMIQRELLYTAVTRAREELYIICEPESFTNGILSQRVKGNTLEEKAEYFKGKAERDSKERLV